MWWRKKTPAEPADLDQAREMRAKAQRELEVIRTQAPAVERVTTRLVNRRIQNHFGEDIQITFTPRGHRV